MNFMKLAKGGQISKAPNLNANLQPDAKVSATAKPKSYDFVDFIKRAKKSQIRGSEVLAKEQETETTDLARQ